MSFGDEEQGVKCAGMKQTHENNVSPDDALPCCSVQVAALSAIRSGPVCHFALLAIRKCMHLLKNPDIAKNTVDFQASKNQSKQMKIR